VKIGLIARGEDRGLGNLTREWARHMDPVRTLLIRPQAAVDAQLAQHCAWFDPDALRATFAGELDEQLMRRFLQGLDVVYSAETFYDWRMCDIARELGVRTVCHAMPEYWKHTPNPTNRFHDPAPPDVWWVPTRWRLDHLPEQTRVVPVPVPLDRFEQVPRTTAENTAIRWLHVVGSRAHADRNGTRIFIGALQHLRGEHVVELRSQGETFYAPRVGRKVHVIVKTAEVEDYWRLYDDADALVLPRRYGGLCLPAIEGMGAGLALVMPDVEPQRSEWPIITIPAEFKNRITTSAGNIPICAPDERELAQTMNWHAMHPGALRDRQSESLRWARMHSWAAQQVVIEGELERALA
jgi:glycosyltransferase involved in cell wall biosynthesis